MIADTVSPLLFKAPRLKPVTLEQIVLQLRDPYFWQKTALPVLVKGTSDHCKTVEFPMKACWKKDAQVVASKPQKETFAYEEFKVK